MKAILIIALTVLVSANNSWSQNAIPPKAASKKSVISYKTIKVSGLNIFYREAGDRTKPVILFLHGFPSSSQMYRHIMNDLADTYYVIAPDYPGFGQSSSPPLNEYQYTFDNLSETVEDFIEALNIKKLSLYVQDYGAPIGFRIAVRRPELIQALLIQNGNAYNEGLGEAIHPLLSYSQNQNPETEKGAKEILTYESTKWQYTDGANDATQISPDGYATDQFYLNRSGNEAIQLALFRDYKNNLSNYEEWHRYFKKYQPATLILWGKNDKIFIPAGAQAYLKDLPSAELHLINGGHFVLEEHHAKAAQLIKDFTSKLK